MSDSDLDPVVAAVADGEPIDWTAVGSRAPDAHRRLSHLRTIASLSDTTSAHVPHHRVPGALGFLLAIAAAQAAAGFGAAVVTLEFDVLSVLRDGALLAFGVCGAGLSIFGRSVASAYLGATFLATASAFSQRELLAAVQRFGLEGVFARLSVEGLRPEAFLPVFVWRFVRLFPVTRRFTAVDRAAGIAVRGAFAVSLVLFAANVWAAVFETRTGWSWWLAKTNGHGERFAAVLFAAVLPAFAVMLARAREAAPAERRRVGVFAWAFVLGCSPTLVEVVLEAVSPRWAAFVDDPAHFPWVIGGVLAPLLLVPPATMYAVMVHQIAGMRAIVSRGARYLLATATLYALTAVPFGILAFYVSTHRHESVAAIVAGSRSRWLVAAGAGGLVLLVMRDFFHRRIDRWFGGQRVERSAVLADLSAALNLARTIREALEAVSRAAVLGLGADAAVLVADPAAQAYVDPDRASVPLPFGSAIATLARAEEDRMLTVGSISRQSLFALLPEDDRTWVRRHCVEAIFPFGRTAEDAQPRAIIALGARPDALSFTRADEQFLAVLASSCAIALRTLDRQTHEDGRPHALTEEVALECPACGQLFEADEPSPACRCGLPLRRAALPLRLRKFTLERVLGSGGMGVVYLAHDIALDRPVAIKTRRTAPLRPETGDFQREGRVMAQLTHPSLATIYGIEMWRGTPMLVQEFMPGGTLQQRLGRPQADWIGIGLDLCDGLDYMHRAGVLHRDIKPSNIGFSVFGRPKLLDFGVARSLFEAGTRDVTEAESTDRLDTNLAGTVPYLSPEAIRGDPPGIGFDLWSLSVVLFEMAAGSHPFADGRRTQINIERGRFVTDLTAVAVPAAVAAFLQNALNHDPRVRPSSAAELRARLAALRDTGAPQEDT